MKVLDGSEEKVFKFGPENAIYRHVDACKCNWAHNYKKLPANLVKNVTSWRNSFNINNIYMSDSSSTVVFIFVVNDWMKHALYKLESYTLLHKGIMHGNWHSATTFRYASRIQKDGKKECVVKQCSSSFVIRPLCHLNKLAIHYSSPNVKANSPTLTGISINLVLEA